MKFLVEQIAPQEEEEVRVRCHDTEEKWVEAIPRRYGGRGFRDRNFGWKAVPAAAARHFLF